MYQVTRLYRSNSEAQEADIVIIGVPDETRSHAVRKGSSKAPDILRETSNEAEFFKRGGKTIPTLPMRGAFEGKKIADVGNVKKNDLYDIVYGHLSRRKVPIIIGGDHSLTASSLKAVGDTLGKTALLYFDAHPDFVSSANDYYGSVLSDSSKYLDFSKSMLIGTRAAEPEEIENAKKVGLEIVTPLDIVERGVCRVANDLVSKIKNSQTYVSIDLDCLDPAFAPGVSVPSPGGLSTIDIVYLLKNVLANGNVIGMDIVELSPDFDVNGMTARVAARILSECIASINVS